jgi:hypothetical protein
MLGTDALLYLHLKWHRTVPGAMTVPYTKPICFCQSKLRSDQFCNWKLSNFPIQIPPGGSRVKANYNLLVIPHVSYSIFVGNLILHAEMSPCFIEFTVWIQQYAGSIRTETICRTIILEFMLCFEYGKISTSTPLEKKTIFRCFFASVSITPETNNSRCQSHTFYH